MSDETVSVVIPTRFRPEQVVAAVRSALEQTHSPTEILVVVDGPDPETVAAVRALAAPTVRLVELPESRGAGGARNAGVAEATGDFVAFLDDDDTWLPGKLAAQLAALPTGPARMTAVLSCQARWHTGDPADPVKVWPTRAIGRGERVGDYLFVRRHAGEGVLATPTLLLGTELARRCPLPTHLRTHEEWDWLLTLQDAGATFHVVLTPLVEIDARPRRSSVSHSVSWRDSLAWGLTRADSLGPATFSAFVLTEVARLATSAHEGPLVHQALTAMALTGRPGARDLARFAGRPLVLRRRARRQAAR